MVVLRMVRPLSGEEFELIHDFLGKIVDEKLVREEDRTIRFLQEPLDGFQQAYKVNKTLINQPVFVATLYRNRRKIKVSEDKYALILSSSLLSENGSCWYFLRNLEQTKIRELLKEQLNHPFPEVRKRAIEFIGKTVSQNDRETILGLLQDKNPDIRRVVVDALAKIALPADREIILKLLKDNDPFIRRKAVDALAKIGDREIILRLLQADDCDIQWSAVDVLAKIGEKKTIIKLLHDNDPDLQRRAILSLSKIALPEDREIMSAYYKIRTPNTDGWLLMLWRK